MTPTAIVGGNLPRSPLPYSPAIRVGPWVFVSGQSSTDDEGKIVAGSFAEEFERSLKNLERVLTAAGLTLKEIVQVRSYLGRQADLTEYNELYRKWFSEPFPARTTLVGCLGDILRFEIDVVAFDANAS